MAKAPSIETLLKSGSAEWNKLRKAGKVAMDHTGATFAQLFSANADLSQLSLVGTEWEKCDLSKVNFRETDLSNAYFHGGRLQDCDFRGANLDGATFEKLKLLRCDFTGARGLDSLELEDVDMDRVVGLGEEEPPPPPPPAQGITAFTREMRTRGMDGPFTNGNEPPPFRPHDAPASLLFRGLKRISPPAWALDVPSLRPPIPSRLPPNALLEGLYREAVKEKLEARTPVPDAETVRKAQKALRLGSKEAPIAAAYLREVGVPAEFRFSSARVLRDSLRAELEVDDLTASIDPRITAALLALRLPNEAGEALAEARRRLSATQLFCALLEAGFTPENNWEEALESSEPALDLAQLATQGDRAQLAEAFRAFAALPDEARLRRLAYLGEAVNHLQELTRLPQDTEPMWLSGPESRECHEREMDFVQSLKDGDIPVKVAELAATELGIPSGQVPEDSEGDLFLHLRCAVCGKEKLLVQSAEA
jgi:hypothetical protein